MHMTVICLKVLHSSILPQYIFSQALLNILKIVTKNKQPENILPYLKITDATADAISLG